ncbi:MAG: endonuclease/exonuclease/phosphatase family protein [Flavobacteriales bacterium]
MRFFFACILPLMVQIELAAQPIHVLTYNIRFDNPADGPDGWPLRKQELAAYVFDGSHSIIGFQEVLHHQLLYLDSMQSAYTYYGVGRDDGGTQGEYAPIFWKKNEFVLDTAETKWLSETPGQPSKGWDAACIRIATAVTLRQISNGKRWLIINTHWDHQGKEARMKSAQIIAQWVSEFKKQCDEVVVMGDFNASPTDDAFRGFNGVLYSTATNGELRRSTFNAFQMQGLNEMHIDGIYTTGVAKSSEYHVDEPKTKSGRQLSDHFPVQVTLQAH